MHSNTVSSTFNAEREFRLLLGRVGDAFTAFPWENRDAYAAWLAQTYYYVKHTTTMIAMAAAQFGVKDAKRFENMVHHLLEERGHDQLLLNDLDEMDMKIHAHAEDPVTALFYQNQYYMIQNEGPSAHLGYALLLEAMCAKYGRDVYARVVRAHGKLAATFLDVHVMADQDHSEAGFKELISLSSETAVAVVRNMEQSAFLYQVLLNRCAPHAATEKRHFNATA